MIIAYLKLELVKVWHQVLGPVGEQALHDDRPQRMAPHRHLAPTRKVLRVLSLRRTAGIAESLHA